jgi:hypothetical protein
MAASVEAFDMGSKSLFKEEAYFSLAPTEVKETSSLESLLENNKEIVFVVLNLKNSSGKVISHNVYWLNSTGNYRALNNMDRSSVSVSLIKSEKMKAENKWAFHITNNTGKIAFFIRTQLMSGNEEILPSFWSANYFTLAPGESTTISVSCPIAMLSGRTTDLKIGGWNIDTSIIHLPMK